MKKQILTIGLCSALLLSSCDTYTGTGAYMGGSIGSILGSAIGGIAGGPRGSDIGTLIGMAGGAAVGASVGNQADQRRERDLEQYQRDKEVRREARRQRNSQTPQEYTSQTPVSENSEIFDATNSADDRLYDFQGKDYVGDYSAQKPKTTMPSASVAEIDNKLTYSPKLEIVNARFVDANEDGSLERNETCKLIFEIMNHDTNAVYDVVPTVVETTGNRNIYISPSVHVEKIEPGKGIRYTAMIKVGKRVKGDAARFCVSVISGGKTISKVNEFNIPIRK